MTAGAGIAPLEDVDRVVDVIRAHPQRGPLLTTLGVAQAAGFMALPRGPLSDVARARTLNALRAAQADGRIIEAGRVGTACLWDTAPGTDLTAQAHCQAMEQAGEHYTPDCPRCSREAHR